MYKHCVPRVGDDEGAITLVQRLEGFGTQCLYIHGHNLRLVGEWSE